MRYLPVLASLAFLFAPTSRAVPVVGCQFGRVQGFVAMRANPQYLVGTVPPHFSDNPRYFSQRYNCMHRSAAIRRVDVGTYDVRFPGLSGKAAFATAISDEGIAASAEQIAPTIYRVSLRGPYISNNVLVRRDVAFSLAVF